MNINMNLVCEHHELSLSVSGWSVIWFIIEPPELLVAHEQLQFHEKLGLGTSGWISWT